MTKNLADTKQLIIDAAIEIFATKGFKGATIRSICAAANQSVGSINYHFRDKEGLYEAVTHKILEDLILKYQPEPENSADLSTEEKLNYFISTYLARFNELLNGKDNGIRGLFILRESMNPSPPFRKFFAAFQTQQKDYLLRIIADLTGKSPKNPDIILSAISIIGQCFHFVFGRKMFELLGLEGDLAIEASNCVKHISKFSLGGIKAVAGEKNE